MRTHIILFSGKQGSGKDSIANELSLQLNQTNRLFVNTIKFADVIYEIHNECIKILKKYGIERNIVKDGPLLQLLGTEWGRNTINPNIWVNTMKFKAKLIEDGYSDKNTDRLILLVTDCRFRNEFDAFPMALRVRLYCPEFVRRTRCSMWRDNTTHPSEVDLDQYAFEGKFDLYLNTQHQSIIDCATLIHAQLQKENWISHRNDKKK